VNLYPKSTVRGGIEQIKRALFQHVNEQLPLLYNPPLAFYFLDAYQRDCRLPTQMLDGNAQLPHGEAVIRQALDDKNPLSLIEFGRDFGVEAIFTQANSRQFIFSVLTLAGRNVFGELQLNIPNLVIYLTAFLPLIAVRLQCLSLI
jgi:hypothetical protein